MSCHEWDSESPQVIVVISLHHYTPAIGKVWEYRREVICSRLPHAISCAISLSLACTTPNALCRVGVWCMSCGVCGVCHVVVYAMPHRVSCLHTKCAEICAGRRTHKGQSACGMLPNIVGCHCMLLNVHLGEYVICFGFVGATCHREKLWW